MRTLVTRRVIRWCRPPASGLLTVALTALVAGAAPQVPAPRFDPGRASDVPTAIARIGPAIVGIRAAVPPDRPSAATLGTDRWGSGVVIEPGGLVLTVGYVVLEARAIEASLRDGRTVPAQVVGHDFESGLALLRLAGEGPYPAAILGRSGSLESGAPVATVGVASNGRLNGTIARITAVRRFVAYWEYLLDRALMVAPQNPAFGGAALVDPDGALVGIVSLRLDHENLAIPIDLFPPVRDALLARGRPDRPARPWLGVRAVGLEGAVVIAGVSAAGPAQAAGLRQGDVIVHVNGDRVADVEDFYRKLWRTAVGARIELGVYRAGQLEQIHVETRDRHAIFQYRTP